MKTGKRLAWFAVLWVAGVVAVGAVAWLLRLVLKGLMLA